MNMYKLFHNKKLCGSYYSLKRVLNGRIKLLFNKFKFEFFKGWDVRSIFCIFFFLSKSQLSQTLFSLIQFLFKLKFESNQINILPFDSCDF